jgi:threonine dehydratase
MLVAGANLVISRMRNNVVSCEWYNFYKHSCKFTMTPSFRDIEAAHARIKSHIHRTPILTSSILNHRTGAELYFKCENFQKVAAFKARGAFNAIFSLSDADIANGVATHSSGNHAAAVALAARERGCKATIVMPENTPVIKQNAVKSYGGEIVFCGNTPADREQVAAEVLERTGATLVHPYNDVRVIAGQGTCAKEFMEDAPKLDFMLAPVSGGGLLAGTAISATTMNTGIQVIGCEPAEADDAFRSLRDGVLHPAISPPRTICDGLRSGIGTLTFPIIQERVSAIHTVSEEAIIRTMRTVWEVMKIIIEPSCAVPLAVVIERKLNVQGKRVGIILTGGNVDLDRLPWQK